MYVDDRRRLVLNSSVSEGAAREAPTDEAVDGATDWTRRRALEDSIIQLLMIDIGREEIDNGDNGWIKDQMNWCDFQELIIVFKGIY